MPGKPVRAKYPAAGTDLNPKSFFAFRYPHQDGAGQTMDLLSQFERGGIPGLAASPVGGFSAPRLGSPTCGYAFAGRRRVSRHSRPVPWSPLLSSIPPPVFSPEKWALHPSAVCSPDLCQVWVRVLMAASWPVRFPVRHRASICSRPNCNRKARYSPAFISAVFLFPLPRYFEIGSTLLPHLACRPAKPYFLTSFRFSLPV